MPTTPNFMSICHTWMPQLLLISWTDACKMSNNGCRLANSNLILIKLSSYFLVPKKQRERLNACFTIDILGNPLHPTESVRNLGVWFDSDFSFSKHVQNVFKGCFIQLRDFRNIRQSSTHDASVSVANAFVSSRLDYCNSLFRSLSKFNLHRLQSIQKSAARIVTNSSKYTRISPVLGKLHWLPIQFRSEFKLDILVYKFIHTGFPKYFAPHLSTYYTTYNTRRSQSECCQFPQCTKIST